MPACIADDKRKDDQSGCNEDQVSEEDGDTIGKEVR